MRALRTTLPLLAALLSLLSLLAPARPAAAAGPVPRLRAAIDDRVRSALSGVRPPLARAEADAGRLAGGTRLGGVTLALSRTAAQEEELQALLADQHDPRSPRYHRWLTPEAFAARFGVADEDLAALRAWLAGHGLRVEEVSRSRDRVRVSGTAAQVEAAFGTELHAYRVDGQAHFAPAAEVTLPAAVAPLVQAITGLSTFRPRPHLRPAPAFTSGVTGSHFVTPGDVDVVYGVGPVRAGGADGAGVDIAVVGQSAVDLSDVERFQLAAGLAVKDPEVVLVPQTGDPVHVSGDEGESDLDLEWTGAMAPGAAIHFVHTGNASTASVWDAIIYAVDQDLAPIVSVSYGICEPALSAAQYAGMEAVLAQAAAQGQSVVVASGDDGSRDCLAVQSLTTAVRQGLAVDYPASSAYVTAVGGTEFTDAAVAASLTTTEYWEAAGGADVIASARKYLPEQAWNDGGSRGAGGGGVSARTPRPAWQAGPAGLPAGGRRLVPDLSLDASGVNAGLVYCSGDSTVGSASCSVGFRDSAGGTLTLAGGTSFGAPMFAGMLALLEQRLGGGRLGVVAPALYRVAADPAAYAAAFHDVTDGGNDLSSAGTYAAGPGYDLATGLGSIDLAALLAAWPAASPGFTVAATDASVAAGGTGTSKLTVVPVDGWSGTVHWTFTSTPSLGEGCLTAPDTVVAAGTAQTASITIRAQSAACTAALAGAAGRVTPGAGGGRGVEVALAAAGLLGLATSGVRRGRRGRSSGFALAVLLAALGLPACGGASSSGGVARVPRGAYVVQVVGTDAGASAVGATASFTLTVR
jgi:subtilase family serine protease